MSDRSRAGKRWSRLLLVTLSVMVAALAMAWTTWLRMPGKSFAGPLPPLDDDAQKLRADLEREVRTLAGKIGERNIDHPRALEQAKVHVETGLRRTGLSVLEQSYVVSGVPCSNLEIEIAGRARSAEIVIVGAHYDSAQGTPGADDNASGTAALIVIA